MRYDHTAEAIFFAGVMWWLIRWIARTVKDVAEESLPPSEFTVSISRLESDSAPHLHERDIVTVTSGVHPYAAHARGVPVTVHCPACGFSLTATSGFISQSRRITMRVARYSSSLTMLFSIGACAPPVSLTPPAAASPAPVVALSGASMMIGVGDIHSCGSTRGIGTAALVDSVLRADSSAKVDAAVFTLGDNAHVSVTVAQLANCFNLGWGDTTRRIIKKLHPTPGNHDYYTPDASAYYRYFGAAAGPAGKGYYSYDVGTWHIVVVNSEIIVNPDFSDAARAEQMDWVEKDLKAHKAPCTIAYWHHPRFSSGWHGSNAQLGPLWQLLYDNDVDLVLSGHDHGYERFRPMTPAGVADTAKGITAIVAGTGGGELRGFSSRIHAESAYRIEGRHGVLLLTLGAAAYGSAFLEVGGRIWDQHGGKCH